MAKNTMDTQLPRKKKTRKQCSPGRLLRAAVYMRLQRIKIF